MAHQDGDYIGRFKPDSCTVTANGEDCVFLPAEKCYLSRMDLVGEPVGFFESVDFIDVWHLGPLGVTVMIRFLDGSEEHRDTDESGVLRQNRHPNAAG